jgi:hypothetical protein
MYMQKNGFAILMEMLQVEGSRLARQHNIFVTDMKTSCGWVSCFMARHNLTIRCHMTVAQRLLEAYEEKLIIFQKYVLKLRQYREYLLGQVGMLTRSWYFLTSWNPQKLTLLVNERCRLTQWEPRNNAAL